tara:strand:+ start:1044 stop:1229 length:186 start_codon:yes stop_codon:yes gene_type:complete
MAYPTNPIYKLMKTGMNATEPDAVEKKEGDFRYVIPFKENNNEYKKFLLWKAEGNVPEEAD